MQTRRTWCPRTDHGLRDCVFVCTSEPSSFALKGRPRGCRGSDRVRPVGTVPASNRSDGAVPSYLCSIRMVGERVCVPECQWGEGRCRGRTSGVRADADNPGEVGADLEGTKEVRGPATLANGAPASRASGEGPVEQENLPGLVGVPCRLRKSKTSHEMSKKGIQKCHSTPIRRRQPPRSSTCHRRRRRLVRVSESRI